MVRDIARREAVEIHAGVNGVLGLTSGELRFVSRSSTPARLRSVVYPVDDRDGCRTGDQSACRSMS
jgi:hypothetical protein